MTCQQCGRDDCSYVDRARPHIDPHEFRCPHCSQTLAAIDEDGQTPPRHFTEPTWIEDTHARYYPGRYVVGASDKNLSRRHRAQLCPVTGERLDTLIFRAQLALERLDRQKAAA